MERSRSGGPGGAPQRHSKFVAGVLWWDPPTCGCGSPRSGPPGPTRPPLWELLARGSLSPLRGPVLECTPAPGDRPCGDSVDAFRTIHESRNGVKCLDWRKCSKNRQARSLMPDSCLTPDLSPHPTLNPTPLRASEGPTSLVHGLLGGFRQ